MGENREIQKGVWEGRIPVVFRLSEDDTEGERPEPVYVSVREVRSDMNQLIFGARIFFWRIQGASLLRTFLATLCFTWALLEFVKNMLVYVTQKQWFVLNQCSLLNFGVFLCHC